MLMAALLVQDLSKHCFDFFITEKAKYTLMQFICQYEQIENVAYCGEVVYKKKSD